MTVFPPSSPPPVPLKEQPTGVPFPTTEWPQGPPPDAVAEPLDVLLQEMFGPSSSAGGATDHFDSDAATAPFGQSLAFVAIHQGRLIAERYGPTAGLDTSLISWSMAKSFAQALIGILVRDGRLNIDEPAPIAAWQEPGDPRAAITTDHLLRMVPGTLFNEDYVDENTSHCIEMLFGSGNADMAAYTASQPSIAAPDTIFNYSSGTTVLISRILADIAGSGEAFDQWMHEVLFDPIGMDATLTFDDVGTWVGSSYLHATARDYAKFGLLYLRDGVWDGRRLLPEDWVNYARTLRAIDEEGGRYGAHWWINQNDDAVFYAAGYETQRIIVDPAADLVLVRLGKTERALADNVDDWLDRVRGLFPR